MPAWIVYPTTGSPTWVTTSATTSATTAVYNSPLAGLFGGTTSTKTVWYTPAPGTGQYRDNSADYQWALQAYRDSLRNQYNSPPSQTFVARAPTIIRPHDEREAAWRREIMVQQAALASERTAESRQRREAATKRAHELLLEHLTPEQRDAFTRNGWFIVQGGRTGQRYRINANRGLAGNVDVVGRNDRVSHRLCAHLDSQLPMGDQLVAQKLMLEFDEDHFLRTANRHAA